MKALSAIKCIVFDLDDTLYHERQFVLSGLKAVAEYMEIYGIKSDEAFDGMKSILDVEGRAYIFNKYLQQRNMDLLLVAKMVDVYRNHKPIIYLHEDACQLINKIYGNYALGLITDGLATVQWNKIRALDIEHYFDTIMVTDEYGESWAKPSELPYRFVTERLGMQPYQCLYIGDNPYKDFIAAKKMGWHTVRINRGCGEYSHCFNDEQHEAEYAVCNLMEIYDMLM
ncbi:MAG: putative hydrolase of the superfamily [Clostridiales bacterium]|nr:putative hydrolase of the superfamily [Clostridiales bacterium]